MGSFIPIASGVLSRAETEEYNNLHKITENLRDSTGALEPGLLAFLDRQIELLRKSTEILHLQTAEIKRQTAELIAKRNK